MFYFELGISQQCNDTSVHSFELCHILIYITKLSDSNFSRDAEYTEIYWNIFSVMSQYFQANRKTVPLIKPRPLLYTSSQFALIQSCDAMKSWVKQTTYRLAIKHTAAVLLAGLQEHQGLIPYRTNIFFPPHPVDRTGGPPTLLSDGYNGPFPGIRATSAWSWSSVPIWCRV